MKRSIIYTLIYIVAAATTVTWGENPKREFRGAWLHVIGQSQYADMTTAQTQNYLRNQLDKLHEAGINAVIFQVRPQADALYESELEPWSRYLTGTAGKAPNPMWDPLQFMVDECHKRGMELHAWLNPYRVTSSAKQVPAKGHIYHKHPERFIRYDGKLYFDPGEPENRKFINKVVADIVTRYNVDAIHMDDYFYPYPAGKVPFPDNASYAKYGKGMDRGDWRRDNVNKLIEELNSTIKGIKPWVRFGISPFGVWRNKTSDPKGSDTQALENYDSLYADVLLWTEKGWVDYMLPQLYWELEHPKASCEKLAYWWNNNANGRHMYYGQAIEKTMDKPDIVPGRSCTQLDHKIALTRELENVQGNCWWPGYSITKNYKGIADSLATNRQATLALVPAYTWIDSIAPEGVSNLKLKDGKLTWRKTHTSDVMQMQRAFVVYAFAKGEKVDTENPKAILGVTYTNAFALPAKMKGKYTVVVTALDAANNESEEKAIIEVKL